MAVAKQKKRKRNRKNIGKGAIYIQSHKSNTIITVTDEAGNTVAWSSAGNQGFKGAKQKTPFAAQKAAEEAANQALEMGMSSVDVYVKGAAANTTSAREYAIRAIDAAGLNITMIKDISPIPHNGCRPPKRRRL